MCSPCTAPSSDRKPPAGPKHGHRVTDYLTGVGTNLFNPKVGVFFVSFLPVFIPRGVPVAATSLVLGAVFLAEGVIWLATIVVLGDRLNSVFTRPAVRRRLERITGVVMVGFGVRLAVERR